MVRRFLEQKIKDRNFDANDNDNDNDNDTLREVPHQSNEGLALQARVSGPWPLLKRICLTGEACSLARCANTNCCGQSVMHRDLR